MKQLYTITFTTKGERLIPAHSLKEAVEIFRTDPPYGLLDIIGLDSREQQEEKTKEQS